MGLTSISVTRPLITLGPMLVSGSFATSDLLTKRSRLLVEFSNSWAGVAVGCATTVPNANKKNRSFMVRILL